MTENIQWLEVHARKAGDEWILDVLGAPFYGPDMGKDIEGDYFSPNTNFMMEIGDKRPVLYFHGDTPWGTPDYMPEVIGRATATRKDGKGLWFEVVLDKTKKHAARIWNAAVKGIAKASTGAVNYLVRRNKVTGELLTWPIGELTLVDEGQGRRPSNEWATVSLKALFDKAEIELPEAFAEADEAKADVTQIDEADQNVSESQTKNRELDAIVSTGIVVLGFIKSLEDNNG